MNKISISRKNRAEKVKWLRTNIGYSEDRYVYMQNGQYRFIIYVYLTSEELLLYRIMFGK